MDALLPPAERYVALFTYESAEPGDLVFQQGDVISVTEKHGEWWTGHLGSASGIFPSNYVQLMEVSRPRVLTCARACFNAG